jgi:hypothetical protein
VNFTIAYVLKLEPTGGARVEITVLDHNYSGLGTTGDKWKQSRCSENRKEPQHGV